MDYRIKRAPQHINGRKNFITPKLSDKEIEMYRKRFTGLMNTMQHIMLDIANSLMLDCIQEIKKRGLYKQKAKRLIRQAEMEWRNLAVVFDKNLEGKRQLQMDMLDIGTDEIKQDVDILQSVIKRTMDRHFIQDSQFKAMTETTTALFCLARTTHVAIVNALSVKTGINAKRIFKPADPEKMAKAWENVTACFCKYTKEEADEITTNQQYKTAIDVIATKLTDADKLNEICKKAIELNQEEVAAYFERHPDEVNEDIEGITKGIRKKAS